MKPEWDAAVVGAGVIGCAIARELARRGVTAVLLDPGVARGDASSAAGGMLAPLAEAQQPGAFLELASTSAELYAAFVDALVQETGIDVAYRGGGKLQIALDDQELAELDDRFAWLSAEGQRVERQDAAAVRNAEPSLTTRVLGGLLLPDEHRVDARRLLRALRSAAERLGVPTISARVQHVEPEADRASLVLENGTRVTARHVVIAAGCWSAGIGGLPSPLPVQPVRGQMLALDPVADIALRHVVQTARCYLIPRDDGRVIVGSTMEDVGFAAYTTEAGIAGLRDAAVEAIPALNDARVADGWAGLRPGTPDGLPILGRDPAAASVLYATGHYRNGILLAPVTARLLADVVTGATPLFSLEPFSVRRFAA